MLTCSRWATATTTTSMWQPTPPWATQLLTDSSTMQSYIRLGRGIICCTIKTFSWGKYHIILYSYGRSSAQILLRWSLQQGCSVVPKSLNAKHITENKQLDFKMEQADIDKIFVLFQWCVINVCWKKDIVIVFLYIIFELWSLKQPIKIK